MKIRIYGTHAQKLVHAYRKWYKIQSEVATV